MNLITPRRRRLGLVAVATVASVAALALVPAFAANAAIVPTVGSTKPLYLLSDLDGSQLPAGSSLLWSASAIASPLSSDPAFTSSFPIPAGATSVKTFISPRGQESTIASWNASGSLGFTAGGIQLPNLKPSGNTITNAGTPAGTNAVANAGGDYSLGIAFLNNTTVVEADYTYITVVANPIASQATWTFATPAAAPVAPVVSTQPADTAVTAGTTATFTAAASGSPTVQWQSAPSGSSTFADISGATSASLSVANTTLSQSGSKYRAVFTNSAGTATSNAATLTVYDVVPTQPTGTDANKVTIADPAAGATNIVIPTGAANSGKTFQVWAWSTPSNLGQLVADASGNVTVPISTLPVGAHTVALTQPGDATLAIKYWTTFTKTAGSYDPITKSVALQATVTASDLWALNAEKTSVDFGNVARGATSTKPLGKVTVIDDRNLLKGWDLTSDWAPFVHGTDVIPQTALAVQSKFYAGYTPVSGITLGTGHALATSSAVSTTPAGALFDADLAFTAPAGAQSGLYTSTLTLTLTSK